MYFMVEAPTYKFVFAIMLAILTTACSTPAMKKAELDAQSNPELCRKALSAGVAAQKLVYDEEYRYQEALYRNCLKLAADKNPKICAGVLAAGRPSGIGGMVGTKQEMQAITDYYTCLPYAKKLDINEVNTSRISLGADRYDDRDNNNSQNTAFGRISSVQIENLSSGGSNSGAQLGAGVGQIAYVENTNNLQGYNPWSQLGAGLAGAVIGSSLDQKARVMFKKTYWVKLVSGDFSSVTLYEAQSGHLPEGMCVAVIDGQGIQQAKENNCR